MAQLQACRQPGSGLAWTAASRVDRVDDVFTPIRPCICLVESPFVVNAVLRYHRRHLRLSKPRSVFRTPVNHSIKCFAAIFSLQTLRVSHIVVLQLLPGSRTWLQTTSVLNPIHLTFSCPHLKLLLCSYLYHTKKHIHNKTTKRRCQIVKQQFRFLSFSYFQCRAVLLRSAKEPDADQSGCRIHCLFKAIVKRQDIRDTRCRTE